MSARASGNAAAVSAVARARMLGVTNAPLPQVGDIGLLGIRVPPQHMTRGVTVLGDASAEGYVAAADALLFEALKAMPIDARAPDGTPVHELHDVARAALRGMLAGLTAAERPA